MPRKPAHLPPVQERSRESLRRMLDAAEAVLARYGLEGTTLPRIAAEARISAANVYRRFRDKDALMAAVFERIGKRSAAETAAQVDPAMVRPMGLVRFSRNIIEGMIRNFRADAGLSRAAVQYAEAHWQADFVRKTRASEARSFQSMVDTFMIWRDQIKHPDPERAVRFGFIVIALALRELILFGRARVFEGVLKLDDETLGHELPRMFLRYLGVEPEADVSAAPAHK
ncbi:MAG TPA: helix-turn-helix domain-containing protein [Candidatus Acidoferrales bacterium]|nr:helix-turn-helix domain-containing protein [Candidatus Acidoferrales bacterium]